MPLLFLLLVAGCSSASKTADEPRLPRTRWYAHCDVCKWCKGSFKTTQEAQAVVTDHNKRLHDWFKVAYYDQTNCSK